MERYQFALIGHPLAHSLSPAIHRAALEGAGLEGNYTLHPIPPLPEGRAALERIIAALRGGEIDGLNVTIPHKQAVLEFLDALEPDAQAAGAVNTISVRSGLLTGDNTDVEGFRRDLKKTLGLPPGSALVLGAGGAARGVIHALLRDGWTVSVAARREPRARSLAARLAEIDRLLEFPLVHDQVFSLQPDLIVNATPLGMSPDLQSSPWPAGLPFPPGCAVYDLVYNPPETAFLAHARQRGVPAAGGLGMLVAQAALAFGIWTGRQPSEDKLHAAAQNALMAMRKDNR